MPQYDYTLDAKIPGQILSQDYATRTFTNPIVAQVSTATVGGTTDGTYTIQIVGPEGTFTASFVASGNTAAQIATGLAAAINSTTNPNPLLGIASATTSTADVIITFEALGSDYAVSFTSDPSTLSSVALTTAAGGTVIPFGRAVYISNAGLVALPASSGNAASVIGVCVRSPQGLVSNGNADPESGVQPGDVCLVLTRGKVAVDVGFAASDGDTVDWRHSNATAATPLGSAGGSAYPDASFSTRAQIRFAEDATPGTPAAVEVSYPA